MESKEISDKQILTKGIGKGSNSVTDLQCSLPEHELDFPSLECILTLRQSCRLCTGIVG